MPGDTAAMRVMIEAMCDVSVAGERRNLRRAGALWNKPSIVTVAPRGCAAGSTDRTLPARRRTRVPCAAPVEVASTRLDTEAIEGSASPRNP